MRTRLLLSLLALALLLSALAGCTGQEGEATPSPTTSPSPSPQPVEQSFTLPYYPSASLHPITGDNRSNLIVTSLVYDPLFALDETFTARPCLALSCATEDGLTHVITLRGDAVFSDGSLLTAEDVAASLELARTSSLYASRLSIVTSVRSRANQVTVTTSVPHGSLSLLLDIPVVRQNGDALPLGTGPYRFSGGEDDLTLLPNPHWSQSEAPPFDQVSLYPITATDMLVSGFDSQEISLISTDLTGTNALGFSGDYEIWDYPTSILQYVGFNTVSGPCRSAALRTALAYGFDRDATASSLLLRHAQASVLPISPASPLYDQTLADQFSFSVDRMEQLLEEAGYVREEDGALRQGRTQLSLSFLVNADNSYKVSVARYLAAQLEEAGIQVTLQELGWEEFVHALGRRNFDLYLGEVKLTADFDLTALLQTRGQLNYGGYSSGEMDALLSAFRAASWEDRPAAAAALCRQVAEQAPIVPLFFKNHSFLTHWGGFSPTAVTQGRLFH